MRCVDLFSGCGGLSQGFQNAGFDIVAAFDNWKEAADVYEMNFKHPCIIADIGQEEKVISKIAEYNPDIIIGGPPCQDFSSAGKRDGSTQRADLTRNFSNIITKIKPNWFVMENVERIKRTQILEDITNQLMNSGYGLNATILDAAFCGVPQNRTRYFLIGCLGINHNTLTPMFKEKLTKNRMTIRDYFNDSLGIEYYYRHPRSYERRGVFSIDEPSPTVRGVNRPVPSTYKKHPGDPVDPLKFGVEPLTTKQRSLVQTFPKSFKFSGTKTNLEQMVGNAVPVKLAEFVANAIMSHSKANSIQKQEFSRPTTSLKP